MGCGSSVASKVKASARYAHSVWEDVSESGSEDEAPGPLQGRWLWEESPDVWQAFSPELNQKLLDARGVGEDRLVYMLPKGGVYEVNFETSTQTHWETGTERRIRFKPAKVGEAAAADEPEPAKPDPKPEPTKEPTPAEPSKEEPSGDANVGRSGEWQWEAGPGVWRRFSPEVAKILIASRRYRRYRVVYKHGGNLYEADFRSLFQRNVKTGYERRIRWTSGLQFQWEMKNGLWVDYEDEENDVLVAAKAKGKVLVRYSARGCEYEVNLEKMEQENISANSSKPRRIRFVGTDLHSDYQAGGYEEVNEDAAWKSPLPSKERQRPPRPPPQPARAWAEPEKKQKASDEPRPGEGKSGDAGTGKREKRFGFGAPRPSPPPPQEERTDWKGPEPKKDKESETEKEKKEEKKHWECSACTLHNPIGARQCEACGHPAPGGGGGTSGPKTGATTDVIQMRCGKCQHTMDVRVPPGSPPGASVQAQCPKCGAMNQAQIPGSSGYAGGPSSLKPASSVGGSAPRPSGRRRAVLIGVNYFGTRAELQGCINDVHNLHQLLTQTYHWQAHDIRTLTDDGRGGGMPTRQNITQALRWLAQDAAPGDVLFFSFSGHGAQQEDPHGYEEDGMNETILPVDFERAGMLTDDEISDYIVKPLPAGVRLTGVMDCCHSGTGLDLPHTWDAMRGMWREEVNPYHSMGDVLMFSGCEDDDTSSDASGMYGAPGGAMTTAFCDVLRRYPTPSYPQLLQQLHHHLAGRGFSQRPVLSTTQQFHFDRPFALDDIHPNMNSQIGRIFRQRFPPRPRPMDGPLADMLGPLGMLAGGMAAGMLGGMVMGGLADALFF